MRIERFLRSGWRAHGTSPSGKNSYESARASTVGGRPRHGGCRKQKESTEATQRNKDYTGANEESRGMIPPFLGLPLVQQFLVNEYPPHRNRGD